jgi:tyrosine-protein phosphatase SIW14
MSFYTLRFPLVLIVCGGISAAASSPSGVPHFYEVNENVYRGGQPSKHGFSKLAEMGVKTVLDLREEEGDRGKEEKKMVKHFGMHYVNVPMRGMHVPTEKQISKALAVLNDPDAAPVFIHCKRGADRTGAVIACYRIGHDNWENRRALSEARELGMSWYQFQLQNYVKGYDPHDSQDEESFNLLKKLGHATSEAIDRVRP